MKSRHAGPEQEAHQPAAVSDDVKNAQSRQGATADRYAAQQAAIDQSPRMLTQRQAVHDLTGSPVQRVADGAAAGSRDVVQLARGKVARARAKEAKASIAADRQMDPQARDMTDGLNASYTASKLDTSEQHGGHARDRHAAKTAADLDGRNRKISSTFSSEEDQNHALEQLLSANRDEVAAWIKEQYADPRLVISGEIEDVEVSARQRQRQIGVTSSGYEYADNTIPRFVDVDTETLSHATAVLERYLIKSDKKGTTPKVAWKLITCYPHLAEDADHT